MSSMEAADYGRSADFQSAAFHMSSLNLWSGGPPQFEAWFTHPEPADRRASEITFAGGSLRFDAPFTGFTFPSA